MARSPGLCRASRIVLLVVSMYLLYLDESGSPNARHFVLAGVAIHETVIHWATDALDNLQSEYFPGLAESVQFHATALRGNPTHRVDPPFDCLSREIRSEILDRIYEIARSIRGTFFAVVVEKSALPEGADPYEKAMAEMLARFDRFINRRYRQRGQRNKGMVIIATSPQQRPLADAVRQFVNQGTRHGPIHNILDIPAFTLSRHNRLLQIADLVANTVYGRYENGHAAQFDRLLPKFDLSPTTPLRGLAHLPAEPAQCYLPCCWPPPRSPEPSRTAAGASSGASR